VGEVALVTIATRQPLEVLSSENGTQFDPLNQFSVFAEPGSHTVTVSELKCEPEATLMS
jgi:hypothetical protein